MRFSTVVTMAGCVGAAAAMPLLEKRTGAPNFNVSGALNTSIPSTIMDVQVLQFAETLELLERQLYIDGINQFSQSDFAAAGFPEWVRERFTEIISQEDNHVSFIAGAITAMGGTVPKLCNYLFPYYDVPSWLALTQQVNGVGPNAYLGASGLLKSPTTLTEAASILTVEARHNAWLRSAVNKEDAFPAAYEQALTLDQVYTLASYFITSCPSDNPVLPVQGFAALNTTTPNPSSGQTITLASAKTGSAPAIDLSSQGTLYATILSGNNATVVPFTNSQITIPSWVTGQSYVLLSKSSTPATDANTIAGPALINVDVPAMLFTVQ